METFGAVEVLILLYFTSTDPRLLRFIAFGKPCAIALIPAFIRKYVPIIFLGLTAVPVFVLYPPITKYPRQFKKQCDDYFYLPSRGEYRGVGGLFYDDVVLPETRLHEFQATMLENFLPSYLPIISENAIIPWNEEQKRWQRIRRGRYLEFNLLEDRGVRFGLAGAKPSRTDAIMISAPPSVEWPYHFEPLSSSPEDETLKLLQSEPLDWFQMDSS